MLKEEALARRSASAKAHENILDQAREYLSGPMDFVASREDEKKYGWRTRITQFLNKFGTTIYDPWNKPEVSGMPHYGKEDEFTASRRDLWSYENSEDGRRIRDELCDEFWPTLHIDLRMTDLADFLIAYCPTNIYSVGTVHEIATARLQHKPVLLVTPRLDLSAVDELKDYLDSLEDKGRGRELFDKLAQETPLRPNPHGNPSLWYMAMLQSEDYFFDGFGFADYRNVMGWEYYEPLDGREKRSPPRRPLLRYLANLNHEIPKRYEAIQGKPVENPDWLIFVEENALNRPQ